MSHQPYMPSLRVLEAIHPIKTSLVAIIATLALASCCEQPPPGLTLKDPPYVLLDIYYDSTAPAAQQKTVLLEEFTGVNCLNCPPAQVKLQALLTTYPDSLIGVSIHNDNPLADPFPPPAEDFETPEGVDISHRVFGSTAIPGGVIDRKDFAGDGEPIEGWPFWEGKVLQQFQQTTPVNAAVTVTSYDAGKRELIVKVKLHYTEDVSFDQNISVMVTESGIISPQKLPDNTTDSFYVHNHVLRGMMTSSSGTGISVETPADRVIVKEFYLVLGDTWNPENCAVVAFVHERDGFWEVLQAAHVDVQ